MVSVSKTILLLISHSCNLNCKYCYEWHKDYRKMTWSSIQSILEDEFSNSKEMIDGIDLLGGEPLTNFDVIPPICEWVEHFSPNTKINIRTNGTLLTSERKVWFLKHKDYINVGLSIDGTPEVNTINRGVHSVDLQYFIENWPSTPVKVTIFPDSVKKLYESIIYLYEQGAKVIAGLAQGVNWDSMACANLSIELDKLTHYYIQRGIDPIEPLYDLNFDKGFWLQEVDASEEPCWKQANIRCYDCDGEVLPCHMFSTIVQGQEKRNRILNDASKITEEQLPSQCKMCPIRWCCKNCMAMNYQHTGNFGNNINLKFFCEAQKVAAEASAEYLILRYKQNPTSLEDKKQLEALTNAIKFIKLRRENG